MENAALIFTHLVSESDTGELARSAEIFKTMNLIAAYDDQCICHLADDGDETPEIVRPGFATLFICFSIWESTEASENYVRKINAELKIDTVNYVSAAWNISDGKLPSLNEAFGRICWKNNFDSAKTNLLPVSMILIAGRRWLMDNLGATDDLFIYDRWEIRGSSDIPVQTANEAAGRIPQKETTSSFPDAQSQLSERSALENKSAVSFFKRPFGTPPPAEIKPAEADSREAEFSQMISSYNTELERWLKEWPSLDYSRLFSLVDWTQKAINLIGGFMPGGPRGEGVSAAFSERLRAEDRKWRDAQLFFAGKRDIQYQNEFQIALNRELQKNSYSSGVTGSMAEFNLQQQQKRMDIMNQTSKEIFDMQNEYMKKQTASFEESNKAWKRAHLGGGYY